MKVIIDNITSKVELETGDIVTVSELGVYLIIKENDEYKAVNLENGSSFFARANSLAELQEVFTKYIHKIYNRDKHTLVLKKN